MSTVGPSFQKMTHHILLHGSLWPTNLEKNLKPCRVYIFIQLMSIKTTIWQSSLFLSDVLWLLWLLQPLSPLDPRRPLHMLYMFIVTCHCPKDILGLGGKASKNKLKDTSFTFPVTNVTILSMFRMHSQEGYCKVLEMNSTSILYSLALLLFEN